MQFFGMASLLFGMIGLGALFFGYAMRKKEEPLTFDIEELRKKNFSSACWDVSAQRGIRRKRKLKDTETFLAFLKTLGIERDFYEQAVRLEHAAQKRRIKKAVSGHGRISMR